MAQAMVTSSTTMGSFVKYSLPGVTLLQSVAAGDIGDDTLGGSTFLQNTLFYMPIRVNDPINLTEIGIFVTGEAGTGETGVAGIYSADVELLPDGSPLTADLEFAIDARGPVASDPLDLDLDRGTYLVSWQFSDNVTLRYITGGLPDTVGFTANHLQLAAGGLSVSRTYDGTNPDPGPTPNAVNSPRRGYGFDYCFGMEYTIL